MRELRDLVKEVERDAWMYKDELRAQPSQL